MKINFDEKLYDFSKKLNKPLYAVGGYVRNFLIDGTISYDIDLASCISIKDMEVLLKENGFFINAKYKRTNTIKFSAGGFNYEYTSFRRETYGEGGGHTPIQVEDTEDIFEDAKRRDFKCNAVYYDIKNQEIIDPLNGVEDIKNKIIDTVISPEEVFNHDGLRLMRLARFVGELGFSPKREVLDSAKANAENIRDISSERIFSELNMILLADTKYNFSPSDGHYRGLKVLDLTCVLDKILPELTCGRGLEQRKDFHKYDVLEHTLRSVLYADKNVRLFALLHDIGKPFSMSKDGNFHKHPIYGEEITEKVLKRLKAPNNTVKQACFITRWHMLDMDGKMGEGKLRKFFVHNSENLDSLLKVKQADYSATKDYTDICPTNKKWQCLFNEMEKDGTPLKLRDLKISAKDLLNIGFLDRQIGEELITLFDFAVENPKNNDTKILFRRAEEDFSILTKARK